MQFFQFMKLIITEL